MTAREMDLALEPGDVAAARAVIREYVREGMPISGPDLFSLILRATPNGGSMLTVHRELRSAWEAAQAEFGEGGPFPEMAGQE